MNKPTKTLLVACMSLVFASSLSAKTITASDNAWVLSGSGDQSETGTLSIRRDSNIAYLRFDISTLNVRSNDLVYLDLYLAGPASSHAERLYVDALNDGVAGETTWNAGMAYAGRPDGTGTLPNSNTTRLLTYDARVAGQAAAIGGGRGQENPPDQISIVINNSTMQSLLASDTNDELTLIISGPQDASTLASLGSTNLNPQLRVLHETNVEVIPESTSGGEVDSTTWNDSGTTARVGNDPWNQILLFKLPRQPAGGFSADDTSLAFTLASNDINPGNWGFAHADLWAIGYVPANAVPLQQNEVDNYLIQTNAPPSETGWNIGTNITQKIYDNLTSPFVSDGTRLAIPPSATARLTEFINGLYVNHGAKVGDYLILRLNPDVSPDNGQEYWLYTGDASDNVKPILTLSPFPAGTLIVLD